MTFEEFVQVRLVALLRYATVLTCDPRLAEDIVQEVMLRTHQRWNRIVAIEQPDAYVKRMVLNEFLSWRRRKAARVGQLADGVLPAVPDHAHQVSERDAMLRRIAALPPRQRAVIALRFYEGCTDAEIATQLGCGKATVRSHSARALAALRVTFADEALRHGRVER